MTFAKSIALACALVMALAAPCRADLFAVSTGGNEVLRIDTASGNVTRTYPFPDFLPLGNPPNAGLAFDGRILYLTRGAGGFSEMLYLDVVNHEWFPPSLFVDTFSPSGPQSLTGLGYRPDEFGGSLVGVSRSIPIVGGPPSNIFQYMAFPFFDPFSLMNTNFPPGELPPNLVAQGADVDPATGDLWISVDEFSGQTIVGRHLIRSDLTGAVLQTVTPAVGQPTLIRGVGFDGGAMFIGGRHLPTGTNNVYEVDLTTGAIIRSFPVPMTGILGGLTGGDVIPEPGSALLIAIALGGVAARYRSRRC
jgi:hypothetical protein